MDSKQVLTRTKAGRRFMGFMRALNRGSEQDVRGLVENDITDDALNAHSAEVWEAQLQYIRAMSGGLRVVNVIAEDEYRVVVLMQAHDNERLHVIDMAVEEDFPHRVAQFIQRLA
ncbi:MAG: hypothetical protein EA396_05000 [Anaerolineaceae bacterium]|nr:MAG: hypothetical protein EA396_05000 [Anaerolineaceae bacterium]